MNLSMCIIIYRKSIYEGFVHTKNAKIHVVYESWNINHSKRRLSQQFLGFFLMQFPYTLSYLFLFTFPPLIKQNTNFVLSAWRTDDRWFTYIIFNKLVLFRAYLLPKLDYFLQTFLREMNYVNNNDKQKKKLDNWEKVQNRCQCECLRRKRWSIQQMRPL